MLVVSRRSTVEGLLCEACRHAQYRKAQMTNLFSGWFSGHSFWHTLAFLPGNWFARRLSMRAPSVAESDDADSPAAIDALAAGHALARDANYFGIGVGCVTGGLAILLIARALSTLDAASVPPVHRSPSEPDISLATGIAIFGASMGLVGAACVVLAFRGAPARSRS
jgi:hypothetical protein